MPNTKRTFPLSSSGMLTCFLVMSAMMSGCSRRLTDMQGSKVRLGIDDELLRTQPHVTACVQQFYPGGLKFAPGVIMRYDNDETGETLWLNLFDTELKGKVKRYNATEGNYKRVDAVQGTTTKIAIRRQQTETHVAPRTSHDRSAADAGTDCASDMREHFLANYSQHAGGLELPTTRAVLSRFLLGKPERYNEPTPSLIDHPFYPGHGSH